MNNFRRHEYLTAVPNKHCYWSATNTATLWITQYTNTIYGRGSNPIEAIVIDAPKDLCVSTYSPPDLFQRLVLQGVMAV